MSCQNFGEVSSESPDSTGKSGILISLIKEFKYKLNWKLEDKFI